MTTGRSYPTHLAPPGASRAVRRGTEFRSSTGCEARRFPRCDNLGCHGLTVILPWDLAGGSGRRSFSEFQNHAGFPPGVAGGRERGRPLRSARLYFQRSDDGREVGIKPPPGIAAHRIASRFAPLRHLSAKTRRCGSEPAEARPVVRHPNSRSIQWTESAIQRGKKCQP